MILSIDQSMYLFITIAQWFVCRLPLSVLFVLVSYPMHVKSIAIELYFTFFLMSKTSRISKTR